MATLNSPSSLAAKLATGVFRGMLLDKQRQWEQQAAQQRQDYATNLQKQTAADALARDEAQRAWEEEQKRKQRIFDAMNPTQTPNPGDEYEDKLRRRYKVEKEFGVGAFKPKEDKANDTSKDKPVDQNAIRRRVTQWQRYDENQRRDQTDTSALFPGTRLTDYQKPPTYGGKENPLPADLYEEVATIAEESGVSDQVASNILYARNAAHDAADQYQIEPQDLVLDVERLQSLPSLRGRNITIPNVGGKTNLYSLSALTTMGWSRQELGQLLDEYFSNATGSEPMNILQDPYGTGQ